MEIFWEHLFKTQEIGHIYSLSHNIAFVSGLPGLKLGEMIVTESGEIGFCHGLKKDLAEVLMIATQKLKIGEKVARTNRGLEIPAKEGLLGRIINPLCQPIDNLGPIQGAITYQKVIEKAPPFIERVKINKFLETGVIIVDLLVPIGLGQRELVIGDAKTGKTAFLLQVIASQAKKGAICIYVGIGKKDTAIRWVEESLKAQGILANTILMATSPDDSPTLIYLAPYSGMAIAEYWRAKEKNVLIIFDDLTTHAKIYREISLLLKRAPGRDCYPGDIFHIQAALMERAGNIKVGEKEVSITALPVAETLENDISGYIQTNLAAMTDGHIFFDIDEYRKGKRPAVNVFLSVSRVGNQTKTTIEGLLSFWLRKKMVEYKRALEIIQFGSELTLETKEIIEWGERLEALFNQDIEILIPRKLQLLLVTLLVAGFWKDKSVIQMKKEIDSLLKAYNEGVLPEIKEKIEFIKDLDHLLFLTKEIIPEIEKVLKNYAYS